MALSPKYLKSKLFYYFFYVIFCGNGCQNVKIKVTVDGSVSYTQGVKFLFFPIFLSILLFFLFFSNFLPFFSHFTYNNQIFGRDLNILSLFKYVVYSVH